ncbi:MAG: pentapeptide repeat-containing protein [Alphaproteobacteria bacterium]|nr:pentapeptide repeat-containing protein [Alphaproteobacteria bacterium]
MSKSHYYALPSGTMVDEYRIESVLGHGGFGITYLATDLNLESEVAIKEYLPADMAVRDSAQSVQPKSSADDADFQWGLDRFVDEARTLARLRHNNIVRVARIFERNGTAYMVTDFERGCSLTNWLAQKPEPPTEQEFLDLLRPLLDGLDKVHQSGFLHRDIKPDNIYMCDGGRPVLLDFGSARQALGTRSRSMTSIVSQGYAPIEQYSTDSKRQGPWSDIYALAAVVYRAIRGDAPVEATARSEAKLTADPDPLVPLAESVADRYSRQFLDALDWALAVLPRDRPQDVAAFRQALLGMAADDDAGPAEELPEHPSGNVRRLDPRLVGAAIGTVAVLAVAGIWLLAPTGGTAEPTDGLRLATEGETSAQSATRGSVPALPRPEQASVPPVILAQEAIPPRAETAAPPAVALASPTQPPPAEVVPAEPPVQVEKALAEPSPSAPTPPAPVEKALAEPPPSAATPPAPVENALAEPPPAAPTQPAPVEKALAEPPPSAPTPPAPVEKALSEPPPSAPTPPAPVEKALAEPPPSAPTPPAPVEKALSEPPPSAPTPPAPVEKALAEASTASPSAPVSVGFAVPRPKPPSTPLTESSSRTIIPPAEGMRPPPPARTMEQALQPPSAKPPRPLQPEPQAARPARGEMPRNERKNDTTAAEPARRPGSETQLAALAVPPPSAFQRRPFTPIEPRCAIGGSQMGGRDLQGCMMAGADLRGISFAGANMAQANLSGADLSGADLSGAVLAGANLTRAKLRDAKLVQTKGDAAVFRSADLSNANVQGASLSQADFRSATVHGVVWKGATIRRAIIRSIQQLDCAALAQAAGFDETDREDGQCR